MSLRCRLPEPPAKEVPAVAGATLVNRYLIILLPVLAVWPLDALHADIITLKNGTRMEGEVVDENAVEIMLRRRFGKGGITYIQSIKRSHIDRLEQAPLSPSSAPASAPSTREAKPALLKKQPIGDKSALLLEAIRKWNGNDLAGAGVALTRLINNSTSDELQKFSDEVQNRLEMPLSEFAAEAHFTAARRASRGRAIRLTYVTSYELPALVRRLTEAYYAALDESIEIFPVTGRGDLSRPQRAGTQPAGEDANLPGGVVKPAPLSRLNIAAWLDRPEDLNLRPSEAAALVKQIQYANSLLAERMRLDENLRRDRTLKSTLLRQRIRLITLVRVANDIATGVIQPFDSGIDEPPPSRVQPEESRGQEMERGQSQRQTYLEKAMRLAQEHAKESTK